MAITKVRITFDKLLGKTQKAYQLQFGENELWFPSKMCWNFVLNKQHGGNMVIPLWLYKEKFGCDPAESEAETLIEYHKPAPKTALMSNEIEDLRHGFAL